MPIFEQICGWFFCGVGFVVFVSGQGKTAAFSVDLNYPDKTKKNLFFKTFFSNCG